MNSPVRLIFAKTLNWLAFALLAVSLFVPYFPEATLSPGITLLLWPVYALPVIPLIPAFWFHWMFPLAVYRRLTGQRRRALRLLMWSWVGLALTLFFSLDSPTEWLCLDGCDGYGTTLSIIAYVPGTIGILMTPTLRTDRLA